MAQALPIILCGQSPQIAVAVKKGLLPEYDVIHIVLTPAQGTSDIPAILQGKIPSSSSEENVGSRNYDKIPVAVVTGGGYGDDAFKEMYDAAKGNGKEVPWLRPDLTVKTPPLGPKYGEHMVGRVKACLKKLDDQGKLGSEAKEDDDGVIFF